MTPRYQLTKINVIPSRDLWDRKNWIKYLIIPHWQSKLFDDPFPVDDKFTDFVTELLEGYIEGKKLPEALLAPIMNIFDVMTTDGKISMRAGDYIALQTHYRSAIG